MANPGIDSDTLRGLLADLERKDDAALTALIRHSSQRLESLARHMLRDYPALRRWVETNDVLQNALIRLIRALGEVQLESPRHYMALAALQIRRELIDLARHYFGPRGLATHHESRAGKDSTRESVDIADVSSEPLALAQWVELHEQLGRLPELERETVDLLYYDGLSQADAAKMLDVSVRTVQRRWQRALLLLHDHVGEQWAE